MSVRTVHKGYGIYDVFLEDRQIGICYKNDCGRIWTGRVKYKHTNVCLSGINNIRDTTDRMAAIYQLLKNFKK